MKKSLFKITYLLFRILELLFSGRKKTTTEPETEAEAATEPTKLTKSKTKCKISLLKFGEEFLNEMKNEEQNINEQIFR